MVAVLPTEKNNSNETLPALEESLLNKLAKKRARSMVRALKADYAYNPLLSLPRNSLCPCRSGEKFKRCCLPTLPRAVTIVEANTFKEQMEKPDLLFITDGNREEYERLKKEAESAG